MRGFQGWSSSRKIGLNAQRWRQYGVAVRAKRRGVTPLSMTDVVSRAWHNVRNALIRMTVSVGLLPQGLQRSLIGVSNETPISCKSTARISELSYRKISRGGTFERIGRFWLSTSSTTMAARTSRASALHGTRTAVWGDVTDSRTSRRVDRVALSIGPHRTSHDYRNTGPPNTSRPNFLSIRVLPACRHRFPSGHAIFGESHAERRASHAAPPIDRRPLHSSRAQAP